MTVLRVHYFNNGPRKMEHAQDEIFPDINLNCSIVRAHSINYKSMTPRDGSAFPGTAA